MCFMSAPKAPDPVPERQAAKMPDNGDPSIRQGDRSKRRLAMASSIFTGPTLGAPTVSGSLGA